MKLINNKLKDPNNNFHFVFSRGEFVSHIPPECFIPTNNGDSGRTPAQCQVCDRVPASPHGNSRNTSHHVVILKLSDVSAVIPLPEMYLPLPRLCGRAGET